MGRLITITDRLAPAQGDLRLVGKGDVISIHASAEKRQDWAGYIAAITSAVWRGAEVRRKWDE